MENNKFNLSKHDNQEVGTIKEQQLFPVTGWASKKTVMISILLTVTLTVSISLSELIFLGASYVLMDADAATDTGFFEYIKTMVQNKKKSNPLPNVYLFNKGQKYFVINSNKQIDAQIIDSKGVLTFIPYNVEKGGDLIKNLHSYGTKIRCENCNIIEVKPESKISLTK